MKALCVVLILGALAFGSPMVIKSDVRLAMGGGAATAEPTATEPPGSGEGVMPLG